MLEGQHPVEGAGAAGADREHDPALRQGEGKRKRDLEKSGRNTVDRRSDMAFVPFLPFLGKARRWPRECDEIVFLLTGKKEEGRRKVLLFAHMIDIFRTKNYSRNKPLNGWAGTSVPTFVRCVYD